MSAATDLFKIPADDLALFQDFAAESAEHLDAIDSGLKGAAQGAWDPLSVYRPFHTMKSLFAFMGLQAHSEVTAAAESLLEAYKTGTKLPPASEIALLAKAGEAVRLQVARIAAGLPQGAFEVLSVDELGSSLRLARQNQAT